MAGIKMISTDPHFVAMAIDVETNVLLPYEEQYPSVFYKLWLPWYHIRRICSTLFILMKHVEYQKEAREHRGQLASVLLLSPFTNDIARNLYRKIYDIFERHLLDFMNDQKLSLSQINEEARLSQDPIQWIKDASGHLKPVVTLSKDATSAPASSSVNSSANSSKAASGSRVKSKPPPRPAATLLSTNKVRIDQSDKPRADSPPRSPRLRADSPPSRRSPSSSRKRP